MERLLEIVHRKAISTLRFAEVERLSLGNLEKKLGAFLGNQPGRISIYGERPVLGVWAVFQYEITYFFDEKVGTAEQVWINLLTNEIDQDMKLNQNRIVYKQEPLYKYPLSASIELTAAVLRATEYVRKMAEERKDAKSNQAILKNDVDRITSYYTELLAENEKRANRKGLCEEKKKELTAKSKAIELERDKQLNEIYNKYNGQVEINLDNGIFYFIPLLEYTVQLEFRGSTNKKTIF